ncbi:MAG TPA: hypothetical protein PLQ19_08015 [Aeromicrobium sp.]|nr:hypothetical protein [Aeromicrobium sp.]
MKMTLVSRSRLLVLAATLAVIFALVSFFIIHRAEATASGQAEANDAATGVAAESLPKILGYKYASIEKDLDSATELMTTSFAKKYTELSPQLVATATGRKIDVQAVVREVAPLECGQECSESTVRVLAFVDQHRTIAGVVGTPAALSVVVKMTKVDGDWLVSDLTTS